MTGVNPFNFSWNLGGLTWNAWGEPNAVGIDDASPVTTTPPPPPPPPPQATDTVTIGSNFNFDLGTYQPPNGWNIDEYMNLPLPIESEVNFDEIDFHDPSFWLSDSDVRPNTDRLAELWHGRLTEEEVTTIDFESYNNSLAKALGVPWPKYQQAVEAARHEIWNSPSQAEQSGGSYYFSFEPSARASNWSNHPGVLPTISSSEAERLQRVVNENPARFQTKEDLISALASGGFFKTDSISGGSSGPDAEGRDQIVVKLKRLWVDLQMANYRAAQADAGGVPGPSPRDWGSLASGSFFQNVSNSTDSAGQMEFNRQLAASPLAKLLVTPTQAIDQNGLEALLEKVGYEADGPSESGNALGVPGWKLIKLRADIQPDALAFGNEVASKLGLVDGLGRPVAWNNAADAARHIYLSIRADRELGPNTGKSILDAHERSGGNGLGEMLMDLTNNHNGRVLSRMFPNIPAATLAIRALNSGVLQTQPMVVAPNARIPVMPQPKTY